MPKIKLTAYSWGQPGKTGRNLRRRGDVVDVTEEQAARLVKIGAATRVKEKPKPAEVKQPESKPDTPKEQEEQNVEEASTDNVQTSEPIGLPKPTATKPTWIKYAVQEGFAADEMEKLTRDEIAAKFL